MNLNDRIIALNKGLVVTSFMGGMALVFDLYIRPMASRLFADVIIALLIMSLLTMIWRKLYPSSFRSLLLFIDVQVLNMLLVFLLTIVGTGLSSSLYFLYADYWYVYVILFLVMPVSMEIRYKLLSYYLVRPATLIPYIKENTISESVVLDLLKGPERKTYNNNLVWTGASIGAATGLYFGYRYGIDYVFYGCFLVLLPVLSAVFHTIVVRRIGLYKAFGFKNFKLEFPARSHSDFN